MQNCQALSMSVSYIMYSGSSMKSIHIKHLENLRDSARRGGGNRRGESRQIFERVRYEERVKLSGLGFLP